MYERGDDGVDGAEDERGVDDEALPHGLREEGVGGAHDGGRHVADGGAGQQRAERHLRQVDHVDLLVAFRAPLLRQTGLRDANRLHGLHAHGLGLVGLHRVDDRFNVAQFLAPDQVPVQIVASDDGIHRLEQDLLVLQRLQPRVVVRPAPLADARVRLDGFLELGLVRPLVVRDHATKDPLHRHVVHRRQHRLLLRHLRQDLLLQRLLLRRIQLLVFQQRLVEGQLERLELAVVVGHGPQVPVLGGHGCADFR
mmetsp:Transcript_14456/g.43808  ORF Transcript_14456/g.43808 Transcript_14456/m.43808 type:complete len:253 (+) Transcript_14456:1098-1856(+)